MKKLLLSIALLLCTSSAQAQNPQCPTRVAGDNTNACASTAFVQAALTGGTTTGVFRSVTINPLTGTTNRALIVNQTGPNTGSMAGNLAYNIFNISDGASVTGDDRTWGLLINYNILSNAVGQKYGLGVELSHSVTTSTAGDMIAFIPRAITSAPNTGAFGATIFGSNPQAIALSGATGYVEVEATECDSRVDVGATTTQHYGCGAVSTGNSHGSVSDGAFEVGSAVPGGEWLNALFLNNLGHGGTKALATTASIIGTDAAATIANIINLPSYTITGSILNVPNISIAGSGAIAISTSAGISPLSITAEINHGLLMTDGTVSGALTPNSLLTHSFALGSSSPHSVVFYTNNILAGNFDTGQVLNLVHPPVITGTTSATKTVRASGGAADCTLIFSSGILTGGSC